MVYERFPFDPKRDKTPVSRSGFIDLKSAMVNNVVPSQMEGAEDDYNGIEDPASILGRPSDVFEAMEMQSHINSYSPPSGDDKDE